MTLGQLKTHVLSEAGIIISGSILVVALILSSYIITQKSQASNLASFQKTIQQNLKYQYLLLKMSNSIRDRMLTVHDINLSSDPFKIDEYNLEFNVVATEFVNARELLLQLNLPREQLRRLGALRTKITVVSAQLERIIDAKTNNNRVVFQNILIKAREGNKSILVELKKLISIQLINAQNNLDKTFSSNEKSNQVIKQVNLAAFLISLFIIIFILRIFKLRKIELNNLLLDLENHNKNLEATVSERTNDLLILQKEHSRINAEIEVNRQIQKFIAPPHQELKQFKNLDIATYIESADEVGGDYIDVLPYQDGQLICIGDVTDHGLMSSIIMLMTQSIIRHQSNYDNEQLNTSLNSINFSLFQNIKRMNSDRHLSLSLLHLNDKKLIISGQHENIIIVRNNGTLELIDTDELGFYVGFIDDIEPFTKTFEVKLEAGDLVLLHTDGITEAANSDEELYGFKRLCEQAQRHQRLSAYDVIHHIIKDLNQFIGSKALYDDIAMIAFKCL